MMSDFLLLAPDVFSSHGGIARHIKLVCDALIKINYRVDVVALHDTQFVGNAELSVTPAFHSKSRFSRQAFLKTEKSIINLIINFHVNFSFLAYLLSKKSSVDFISFIYGIDVWQKLPFWNRWALNQSQYIFSISNYTTTRAVQANSIKRNVVKLLPCCLAPTFSMVGKTPTIPKHKTTLLTVSRLPDPYIEQKGHRYVLQAFCDLQAHHALHDMQYWIVGDGPGKPYLENLVTEYGIKDKVFFFSNVSDAELEKVYLASDIFVMPSRGEGFGIVFLEAMAHGLPVICGNEDASPEVVLDGVTGFTVNPRSHQEISAAIRKLIENPDLRHQMGQAGQKRVKENFSFEAFKTTLNTYIHEALSS
jgi:phosphatidylinositol alpha-1,6-mannosyltransferase